MSSRYDVAQVCLNGHLISDHAQSRPEFSKKFCPDCGAETVTQCPDCGQTIQGAVHSTYLTGGSRYLGRPPVQRTMTTSGSVRAFCHACGKPYPWTRAGIETAKALALEFEELNDAERIQLQASIDDLVTDTPKTNVAVVRFKKLMPKVGKHGADALKAILIDLIAEGAKKALWP